MPRLPPVIFAALVAGAMWTLDRWLPLAALPWAPLRAVAVALGVLGGLLALLGVVEFRRAGTSVDPRQPARARALVRGGLYRWTRNPMYLGMLLALVAWALWLGSAVALLAGPPLFVAWLNRGQIRAEEAALERIFGDAFRDFRDTVPRWCWPFSPRAHRDRSLALRAGALYFALVFAAGFALGALRVTLLVPRLGTRTAELLEMPLMLAITLLAARWVLRRLAVPPRAAVRLGTGLVALALLLAAEFALVLPLRGLTPAEYFATRDPVSSTAYYASLAVLALAPLLLRCWPSTVRAEP